MEPRGRQKLMPWEVSTDVLRRGTFAENNWAYKRVLLRLRVATVPNIACARMVAFHASVRLWNSARRYIRHRLVSPNLLAVTI